ncbi:MAG TPA: LuxR C-terminal-related transcriptional regulator [Noviherbaspirillum sp.]
MSNKVRDSVAVLRLAPSKLKPPAMGAPFVARARLVDRFEQAAGAKLTLVQAPAGFGKTTLLRHLYDIFRADGCIVAWMTIDAGDNDLDRFMTCLGQAFQQLQGNAPADNGSFDLAQAIESTPLPFMLILDEFEHLQNPAAFSVVEQMVDLLGPQQRIVIGTREQPMLSMGRLRARQLLLEIDAAQLRFSVEETAHFLRDKRNLMLDPQDIEQLHQVTGGWAAALWLSSLVLENSEDPKRFIRTFSGSNTVIASYLAEDVLSHKPKHLQDFILKTSILQKFCADSCNAVTEREDSRELIREIERSNMFLVSLDEQQVWYSYHPLFAGFLRSQLERQHPGLAASLHRRAALWHVGQQRATPAIDHAIASGDRELVLTLLARHAEALFLQGRVRMLARWFDTLDRLSLAAYPKLISVYAWSLIHTNRSAEALDLLEAFNEYGNSHSLPHPRYLVLKTFSLCMLDRIEETAPMWEDPHIMSSAAQEPLLRSMLMIGCAYYYATVGRYKEARLLLDSATREQSSVGPLFSIGVAGYVHGMLDLMQGFLRAAGARLRALIGEDRHVQLRHAGARLRAIAGVDTDAPNPRYGADSGFASLYLAEVLYETDALDEAKRLLKLYLPLVKDAGIPDQLIASHLIYARILRSEGSGNDALQALLELEQLGMQRRLPRLVDMARLERARHALLDGDSEAARGILALVGEAPAWLHRGMQMVANDIETPALGHLRWQIHSGQAAAVLLALKEQLQQAHAQGRVRYALRVKLLYAIALHQSGQRNPALRAMRETLQEALQEGFVRLFKDEAPLSLALMRDVLDSMPDIGDNDSDAVRAFAERILQRRVVPAPASLPGIPAELMPDHELTAREFDVLTLLAKGYGNQAIAEKLFVSIATVKTHLRNINTKLGSHTRTEAISIARKQGIIS